MLFNKEGASLNKKKSHKESLKNRFQNRFQESSPGGKETLLGKGGKITWQGERSRDRGEGADQGSPSSLISEFPV